MDNQQEQVLDSSREQKQNLSKRNSTIGILILNRDYQTPITVKANRFL